MMGTGENAVHRRRGKTLRQKDRFRTDLWKGHLSTDEAICRSFHAKNLSGKKTEFILFLFGGFIMYEMIFLFFEIIGTVAFAVSGALTGLNKKMDMLGVCVLGCVTAVGGGVIRDLILGITPPKTFENPVYVLIALATSLICFMPVIRKAIDVLETNLLMLMDSIGLGIFTVVGIQTAQIQSTDYNLFLLIFVGVITGVGGGVIRDILANDQPYIFCKHFYATASIIGAAFCSITWGYVDMTLNILLSVALILVLRLFAARFRWQLPKA